MKKVILCIMDGVGLTRNKKYNAFYNAKTPNIDRLFKEYPHSKLVASGVMVGLPKGQMGNSEVGHTNMGAGRVVYQSLEYINKKIKDKSFFENEEFLSVINHVKENNSSLHLVGLLSDGGVHSHINHLFNLLKLAKMNNITNTYIHVFTDGRDVSPVSGINYIKKLEKEINKLSLGEIVTISGRYYGMDRDNRWDRVKKAYDVMTTKGDNRSVKEVWKSSQEDDITDEFIIPTRVSENGVIKDNDGIIFFNYRPDRLRELINSFTDPNFSGFYRKKLENIKVVSMMKVANAVNYKNAFSLDKITNTLGETISKVGKTQLRIAETEKYAHVTFFFDGGEDKILKGEERILINSPKVATYDLKPEMSAREITSSLLEELSINHEDLVILNFANGDMVGHTGDYEAAIKAMEEIDSCIGKIVDNLKDEYTILITADHGNCEVMKNKDGSINTSHTTNKVPFVITDKNVKLNNGALCDIAPTILSIMDISIPKEMTGKVLIKDEKKK